MIVFFPNIAMRSFMQWWRARDFFGLQIPDVTAAF